MIVSQDEPQSSPTGNEANDSGRRSALQAELLEGLGRGTEFDLESFLERHAAIRDEILEWVRDWQVGRQLLAGDLPAASLHETQIISERDLHFGPYELIEELGRGGMAVVYRARHRELGREVALKVTLNGRFSSVKDIERLRNEAAAIAQLDHPNIAPVYEVGEYENRLYFTMKLIRGRDLSQCPEEFLNDPRRAATLVLRISRAIQHAHERGILHRDLKPSNILVDEEGEPHVTDFGLARRLQTEHQITCTGDLVGTPSYMAPEQTTGHTESITTATDVYGLGAILYTLLTARPPVQGKNVVDAIRQVQWETPRGPRSLNVLVDRDLETICLCALDKEPVRRYASAREFGDDLERYLAGSPINARPVRWYGRSHYWIRRHPARAIGLTVAVTALSVFGWLIGSRNVELRNVNRRLDTALHEAMDLQSQSEQLRRETAELLYASDMKLAHEAMGEGDIGRLRELLERHRPREGAPDVTGFEWGYLDAYAAAPRPPGGGVAPRGSLWPLATAEGRPEIVLDVQSIAGTGTWMVATRSRTMLVSSSGNVLQDLGPLDARLAAIESGTGLLAVVAGDADVQVLRLASGGSFGRLVRHRGWTVEGRVSSLSWDADGRRLAVVSESEMHPVTCWDIEGRLMDRISGVSPRVTAFSPNGSLLALDAHHDVILWSPARGYSSRSLSGHVSWIQSLTFSPDGSILASGGDGRHVKLWDVASGRELSSRLAHRGTVEALAFSPDGRSLVSSGADGVLKVWHVATGQEMCSLESPPLPCRALRFSEDSSLLVALLVDGTLWALPLKTAALPVLD